jgi:hypothetical protein
LRRTMHLNLHHLTTASHCRHLPHFPLLVWGTMWKSRSSLNTRGFRWTSCMGSCNVLCRSKVRMYWIAIPYVLLWLQPC